MFSPKSAPDFVGHGLSSSLRNILGNQRDMDHNQTRSNTDVPYNNHNIITRNTKANSVKTCAIQTNGEFVCRILKYKMGIMQIAFQKINNI